MLFSTIVNADWQTTLNANFDNVDTFDGLTDWKPARPLVSAFIQDYPSDFSAFTSRTDGGMVWQMYQVYTMDDFPNNQYAIKDHGSGNRWVEGAAANATNHKSLCVDYQCYYQNQTLGTQRIAWQYGYPSNQGPNIGYDEMYFFYMQKLPWGFYNTDGANVFPYHNFIKFSFVGTGFNTVGSWGTPTEHAALTACGAATQALHEYGSSGWLFFESYSADAYMGGTFIHGKIRSSDECGYTYTANTVYDNPGWGAPIYNRQWIGVEQRIKKADPDGANNANNGIAETWIYDESGNVLYHGTYSSLEMVQDGPTLDFTHKINKLDIGGNRCAGWGYENGETARGHTTGGSSSTVIIDSSATFTTLTASPVDKYLWNVTDMSYAIITSRDSDTQLTCDGLRGGTDNTFQTGDEYLVSLYFGPTEHMYIDDVIVNGSRIGPTYFSLLNQSFTQSGKALKTGDAAIKIDSKNLSIQ